MRSDLCQLEVDQNFFTLRKKGLHFLLPKKPLFLCIHCKTELPLAGNPDLSAGQNSGKKHLTFHREKGFLKEVGSPARTQPLFWNLVVSLLRFIFQFQLRGQCCSHVERPPVDRTQVTFPCSQQVCVEWILKTVRRTSCASHQAGMGGQLSLQRTGSQGTSAYSRRPNAQAPWGGKDGLAILMIIEVKFSQVPSEDLSL